MIRSNTAAGNSSTVQRALRPLVIAGAAMGATSSLSATIIYSGTPIPYEGTRYYDGSGNVTSGAFQSFSINGTDGLGNFKLYAGPDAENSPTFKVTLRSQNGGAITDEAALFDVIGSGSSFSSQVSVEPGQHYFGLSINNGEMYGWVSMMNSGDGMGSVQQWAYQDNGGSIPIGAIPEPATTGAVTAAMAALLAGSAAVMKRRRAKCAAIAA